MKYESKSEQELEQLKTEAIQSLLQEGYSRYEIDMLHTYLRSIVIPILDNTCNSVFEEVFGDLLENL